MKFTLIGDIPSKKNSRAFGTANGRIMSFPGANYKQWHRFASHQLLAYNQLVKPWPVKEMILRFFPSTKRKADLTNKAESIMDLLVDNSFLVDDNWFEVGKISLVFGGVDPENPRAEIEII